MLYWKKQVCIGWFLMTFSTEIACGGLSMKRLMLLIMLGGLLLAVAGCSSGGGGGGGNDGNGGNGNIGEPVGSINVAVPGTYQINSAYQITKNGATIKLTLQSIQVTSDHKLKLNCIWLAQGGSVTVEKESDSGNTRMYLKDNTGRVYGHYQGEGAAYTKLTLPIGTSVTGAFYFYALNNTAEFITFFDDNQNQKIGPITVNR
jgi:hypothetical protein